MIKNKVELGLKQQIYLMIIVSVIFCVVSVTHASDTSNLDEKIKKQELEYQKIQKQITDTKKKLSQAQAQEKSVSRQIQDLSQKITLTQQKVNIVSLNIKKISNNITQLTNDIVETDNKIKRTQFLLSERLVSIYKYGGITEFNLLLSSQGAEEALNTSYLLGKIADQDKELINELQEEKKRLSDAKEKLEAEHKKREQERLSLATKKKELDGAANDRNALLAKVRKNKSLFMAEQKELMKASAELQSTIKRLLAEKIALNKKRFPEKKEVVYYRGGRLAMPTQGTITSTFGTRVHPVFKTKITHTGLDIAAPHGTAVVAADSGEILYTGWMRGYGQVIIIDHGANLTTVYAHLSSIECEENAKVTRGSLIGRVGSTGVTTGNHLHFEVRVNGNAVNPMRYLQ
ncbi:MAG: murein hydrolase activator EnvC family protein [Synergistaceae bacterium]